ncbi:hypothetical protein OEZ86_009554 [Tetradesmus obliquus]|uniref:Peptidase C1A papain C-terminal domain-containing protein n=1 Tax=Tetradesmus obliquus TaxID=3088 RepID=A0ABY8UM02_TETOB|nr:hypothetical protein OEZ85_001000 [Tetradesmus obliquus]WIA43019.1 hypothetical protein OEZ86_009554 [Tetradesmus obliquus]
MLILRSPLPWRPPRNPTTAPDTFPAPTCPGVDAGPPDAGPPDFEKLADTPYSDDDKVKMVNQTMEEVAAKRRELEEAFGNPTRAWAAYKAMYGLDFGNSDLEKYATFQVNLRTWKGKNDELAKQGDDTMAYGVTRFAHMTPEAFKALLLDPSLGRPITRPPGRRLLGGAGEGGSLDCGKYVDWSSSSSSPPSSWDWRAAGSITPVRNQGQCGSCSNMAATAAIENVWVRKWWGLGYRSWNTDLAEQDFLDCTKGDQCKGSWPDSVMDRYICRGAAFESALPYKAYDAGVYPCKPSSSLPRYNTGAKSFMYVPPGTGTLARAVMKAPTVIGVDASNWQGLAAGWVRNCGEANSGLNHGVAVVGWVDDVKMSNGQTWDYWIIKNSWGTGFCNKGYLWVRKDCNGNGPYGMYTQNHWVPNKS